MKNFESLQFFLVFLGIALIPIYAFDSGGLQPSHMLLALFAVLTMLHEGLKLARWNVLLLMLALYGTLIELIYLATGASVESMINAAFLIYNFAIPYAIYQYCTRQGEKAIALGIICAGAIAVITVMIGGVELQGATPGGRTTGAFNNPNQLGYFAVCLLSLSYVLFLRGQIRNLTAVTLFAASIFLAIASLSKAAMVATFLVILVVLQPILSRRLIIVWSGVLFGIFALFVYALQAGRFDQYFFMQRLLGMTMESDSSLESRGYLAFLNGDFFQTLFGLGSENVIRLIGHEVHSTFFAILSNYGIVGLFLFLGIMVIWFKALFREYGMVGLACIAGPSMLYGLTHNGTRFTIFWVLFAVSLASTEALRRRRNDSQQRSRSALRPQAAGFPGADPLPGARQ